MSAATRRTAFLWLCAASQGALAHGSVQGLGHFFGGVVHPLLEPAHLIALLALGLLIGQRGLAATRPAAPVFVLGAGLIGLAVLLMGSGVGVCVWMFNVVGLVHEVRRPWLRLGVRVVGSWIAASAVLVMALWLVGPPRGPAHAPPLARADPPAAPLVLNVAR